MNIRMTELYRKAMEFSGNTGTTHFEFMNFVEEFSKSIVNECANIVQDCVDRRVPASEYPTEIKKLLRNPT